MPKMMRRLNSHGISRYALVLQPETQQSRERFIRRRDSWWFTFMMLNPVTMPLALVKSLIFSR